VRVSSPESQSLGTGVPADRPGRLGNRTRAGSARVRSRIPEASIARLPLYLRALHAMADRGVTTVSSEELAAASGVNSAKLRKDLSHLGSYGTRGVGYEVAYLVYQISRELGLTQDWPVVIIGIGNLGRALANYGGFATRGFRTACLVDADPHQVGQHVSGLVVRHLDDLEALIAEHRVAIGVIATPAGAAQAVADRLVAAGVRSVLNFAPAVLNVPPGVELRKVDLSTELQILAFHEQRRVTSAGSDAVAEGLVAGSVEVDRAAELRSVVSAGVGLPT
jgi:redox-sensing transcriptional repressor